MTSNTTRRLAAIVFADMVGYSRLMGEDEPLALRLREEFSSLASDAVSSHSGEIIKTVGDGIFAALPSAVEAVRAALELQSSLGARNQKESPNRPIEARIGIHLGDVIEDGEDLLGSGVNVAARIEPLAPPGGICISGEIYQQVKNQPALSFQDYGERALHNIEEPVRIYAVTQEEPEAEKAPAAEQSIAVLPFQNMSPDPENEYFADGMTEEIITHLSKIGDLKVISRSAVFRYKGESADPREVGRELGVGSVLEGSVRKHANRLRITAQLINTTDGFHLWSEAYDRDLEDVFAIQSEIAEQVADAFKVDRASLERGAIAKKPTDNLDAYTLYLQGRYEWNKFTGEGMERSLQYYQKAIDLDPEYALAYAGMADTYIQMAAVGVDTPAEILPKAVAAAEKALELDASLAEPYASLGWVALAHQYDPAEAESRMKRAIQLNPSYSAGHAWYGMLLDAVGRGEEAPPFYSKARELDPVSGLYQVLQASHSYYQRRYDEAIERLESAARTHADFFFAHERLGWPYLAQGRWDEAIASFGRAIELAGRSIEQPGALGYAYALAGRRGGALQELEEIMNLAGEGYVSSHNMALIHMGLGEADKAFEWLDRAYEERSSDLSLLGVDPVYDPLRSDPRFDALLRKVGLSV